jgi:hypothetical protein
MHYKCINIEYQILQKEIINIKPANKINKAKKQRDKGHKRAEKEKKKERKGRGQIVKRKSGRGR